MTFLRDLNIILNSILLSVVLLWLSGRLSISGPAVAPPTVKSKAPPRKTASVRLYERTAALGDDAKEGGAKDEGKKQD
ncbi:hypothetical protein Rhopal_007067-T1 [Rhodotorula paludigena]|uniref:Uncharacterized protein n=1 Tax=Rhodotorula paludigena TaxID=86838 RepID=A0AAV5GVL9_9BASI|nr:hypothetical protein Rhopal_007067-T1 [Rhodotorula paludigena]